MKKLIILFGLSTLLLTSCSPGDSSSSTDNVLVRRTFQTWQSGTTCTTNYTYNGHKMLRSNDAGGSYDTYTYAGNLLTEIKSYDNTNTLVGINTFIYNSDNKLIRYLNVVYESNQGYREDFVYNSDGTVSGIQYYGDSVSQTHESNHDKFYLSDGNISTIEQHDGGITYTTTYATDNKNNPFKNVTGFDVMGFVFPTASSGMNHNLLTQAWGEGAGAHQYTYTYTYNSLNYPLTSVFKLDGDTIHAATMHYTYY